MKIEDIAQIKKGLKDVKPKPAPKTKEHDLNLKEIVFELGPNIEKLRQGRYSYVEITGILKQKGITISSQTLSRYMSDYRGKVKKVDEIVAEKLPEEPEQDFIQLENETEDEVVFTYTHT